MSDLMIGAHAIRRDGDMWCLTDLWRASGAPKERRPNDFMSGPGKAFADFLRDSLDAGNSGITKTRKIPGGGGETWAHWQLAIAFAKWLSPEFHARVNEVYRAFTMGQLVPRNDEAVRLALRIERLSAADYESLWEEDLHLEIARLRKVKSWRAGRASLPMAYGYGFVWRMMLGESVYRALKERNPEPKRGSLHGQWLSEARAHLARREDLVVSLALARRATTWADYEADMRAHFRRAPIQLAMPGSRARLKGAS